MSNKKLHGNYVSQLHSLTTRDHWQNALQDVSWSKNTNNKSEGSVSTDRLLLDFFKPSNVFISIQYWLGYNFYESQHVHTGDILMWHFECWAQQLTTDSYSTACSICPQREGDHEPTNLHNWIYDEWNHTLYKPCYVSTRPLYMTEPHNKLILQGPPCTCFKFPTNVQLIREHKKRLTHR